MGHNILDDPDPLPTLQRETNATFYKALGQRLGQIQDSGQEQTRFMAKALLQEVLKRGPRDVDLAVFLLADQAQFVDLDLLADLRSYLRRVEADSSLLRVVGPMAFRLLRHLKDADDDRGE